MMGTGGKSSPVFCILLNLKTDWEESKNTLKEYLGDIVGSVHNKDSQ